MLHHAREPLCASRARIKPKERQAAGPRACPKHHVSRTVRMQKDPSARAPCDVRAAPMTAKNRETALTCQGAPCLGAQPPPPPSQAGPAFTQKADEAIQPSLARCAPQPTRVPRLADVRASAVAACVLCSSEFKVPRAGLGLSYAQTAQPEAGRDAVQGGAGWPCGPARWPGGQNKHTAVLRPQSLQRRQHGRRPAQGRACRDAFFALQHENTSRMPYPSPCISITMRCPTCLTLPEEYT